MLKAIINPLSKIIITAVFAMAMISGVGVFAQTQTVTNTATVTSNDTIDPNPDNNTATTTDPILNITDIAVTKTNQGFKLNSNVVSYTLRLENLSQLPASNVVLTDQLSYNGGANYQNFRYTRNPDSSNTTSTSFTMTYNTLAPSEIITINYQLLLSQPSNSLLQNNVNVVTSTNEVNLANNTDSFQTQVVAIGNVVSTLPRSGGIAIVTLLGAGGSGLGYFIYSKQRTKLNIKGIFGKKQ